MYDYPHYKETDRSTILEFMRQHPFVTLIANGRNGRSEATQVPVLLDEQDGRIILSGHIARKSSHHDALVQNPEALVLFTGPHVYVSGTWYTGNLQQASTWNYISIHARGKVRWMKDDQLIQLLQRLSLYFERGNIDSTTVYNNLPDDYKLKLVKAIDGFEMEVTSLENVHKLSQNRDEKSYDNIINELKKQDGDGRVIGSLMEQRKDKVFRSEG